jgi:valyl-tRNA synthetase
MAYTMNIITKTRALRSDYGLSKEKPEMFIKVVDVVKREFLNTVCSEIATLTLSSAVNVMTESSQPPRGCGVAVVDEKTTIHLSLIGVLDATKEIEKLEKKRSENESRLESLRKKISSDLYIQKTPDNIKQADAERLQKLEAELGSVVHHINDFKALLDS